MRFAPYIFWYRKDKKLVFICLIYII